MLSKQMQQTQDEDFCSVGGASIVKALPESIVISILTLNKDDWVWNRQVCTAARDAFARHNVVRASSPSLPLWALKQMLISSTSASQLTQVSSGRAAAADIPGLTWLFKTFTNAGNTYSTFGPAVCEAAAASGHLNMLQWLRALRPACGWDFTVCTAAARSGKLDVLKWLRSQEPRCPWAGGEVWDAAASSGSFELLNWLKLQQCPGGDSSSICSAAAATGQVAVLDWLQQQQPPCLYDELTLSAAVTGGHVSVLHWLQQREGPNGLLFRAATAADCTAAAGGGHLEVLRFLREQISPPCPFSSATCVAAAAAGHLGVLRYLRAQHPPCPWSPAVCAAAAAAGHLHVLQWLRSQEPPCPWNHNTCKAAAEVGRLEVLKWLRTQDEPCPFDEAVSLAAVQACQLEVAKWLFDNDCPFNTEQCWRALFLCNLASADPTPAPYTRGDSATPHHANHSQCVKMLKYIDSVVQINNK